MAGSSLENIGEAPDADKEATEAVEELIAEFGVRAVVAACLHSSAGEAFGKVAPNETLRVIQVILHRIVFAKPCARLEAEIMALGAGVLLADDQTMSRVAKRYGMTRAAISKRVLGFTDEQGLPPSQFMRSKKDRETYALTNQPRIA